MRIAGHSLETPRRWWITFGIGELRIFRWGVEVYVGPPDHFLALWVGTCGRGCEWVAI